MTDILIEGGRTLLGDEITRLAADRRPRDQRRRRRTTAAGARHRCPRPAGAAGHRRSAWRRVRTADDAAPRRRFPDRCGAGRQRPAGDRQRHHHGLSRHDLVVGAGPAQRRQCAAAARGDRDAAAAARGRHPLPSAPRDLQSRCRSRDREWLSDGRIDLFAFNDHMDSTVASLAKPQKRSRMVERTGFPARRSMAGASAWFPAPTTCPPRSRGWPQAARAAGVRMLSHDDESPAMRQAFRAQGVAHRRISGQRGDRARGRRSRRLHRVRRAQCRARRQPYRMDQGVRHDRQGPVFGAGVRLLLSGAIAGGVSPCRRRRAAAGRKPGI